MFFFFEKRCLIRTNTHVCRWLDHQPWPFWSSSPGWPQWQLPRFFSLLGNRLRSFFQIGIERPSNPEPNHVESRKYSLYFLITKLTIDRKHQLICGHRERLWRHFHTTGVVPDNDSFTSCSCSVFFFTPIYVYFSCSSFLSSSCCPQLATLSVCVVLRPLQLQLLSPFLRSDIRHIWVWPW